jgi:hypothetical protein
VRRSMQGHPRWRWTGFILGPALLLGACAHGGRSSDAPTPEEAEINTPPTNYKADILGAMHAYLNDPTGIRDTGITEPAIKDVEKNRRYVACVRFNAKKAGKEYAGTKEIAAVFIVGRFDRFIEKAQEQCAGATYAPFPELEKLSR